MEQPFRIFHEGEGTSSGQKPGKKPWTEGRVITTLNLLCDLVILNLLWVLCSLPVVTIGAAGSAAYAVAIRLCRREDIPVVKTYFHHFRQSFGQATLLWLLCAAAAGVGAFDLFYAFGLAQNNLGLIFAVVGVAVLLLTVVGCAFAWPLEARYHNTLAGTVKNAFALAKLYPGRMVLIVCTWVVPVGACLLWPSLLVYLGWVWVLCGGAALFFLAAWLCEPVFVQVGLQQEQSEKAAGTAKSEPNDPNKTGNGEAEP